MIREGEDENDNFRKEILAVGCCMSRIESSDSVASKRLSEIAQKVKDLTCGQRNHTTSQACTTAWTRTITEQFEKMEKEMREMNAWKERTMKKMEEIERIRA